VRYIPISFEIQNAEYRSILDVRSALRLSASPSTTDSDHGAISLLKRFPMMAGPTQGDETSGKRSTGSEKNIVAFGEVILRRSQSWAKVLELLVRRKKPY